MARPALRRRGLVLALLGASLVLSMACSSQKEQALSALHYFQRGNAAYQAEDYQRAIQHYQEALHYDDSSADIYYNLGLAYYRVADYQSAVKAYQQAVRIDPTFADAHLNLALAYDRLYNAAAANLHYNRYRAINTGRPAQDFAAAPVPVSGSAQPSNGFQAIGGAAAGAGVAAAVQAAAEGKAAATGQRRAAGAEVQGASAPASAALAMPKSARPGSVPPARSLQEAEQPQAPNPFQGNRKWWTQDTVNPNP